MTRRIENIRNIGIIAHIDAGKTTVTERMLYYSGAKHRVGMVDKGTTETDDDPEEQERGITIYSACVTFDWKDIHINLLDTPGHVDFTAEVERCLRVLDGAVVVFSAREGVEAQSETVWRQANRYQVPRVAFINKMDREGADFYAVLDELSQRLGANPVPLQIPVGAGPAHTSEPFTAVIDLIEMKQLVFDASGEGKDIQQQAIPDELAKQASQWREQMLESLYGYSDELMQLALEESPIPTSLIYKVLREATLSQLIQPILCGTALHGIGVQPLLDSVMRYLPSPLDRPAVEGIVPARGKEKEQDQVTQSRSPDPQEPFCGLVFKVLPARTADLTWVRIYSGTLKANTRVLNPGRDIKDNVAQLWQIHATRKESQGQVNDVSTGDIVGIIGLRNSVTGDTLCDTRHPLLLESISFPETVISMAIEPDSATERAKLGDILEMLQRQDPTLQVKSGDSAQTLLGGMGELHLEVIKHRLQREFNLEVKFHKPQVSYRETVQRAAEVTGKCNRQLGGQQKSAELTIRMEPMDSSEQGVEVRNQLPPLELPANILDAVLDELGAAMQGGGVIAGFALLGLRVTVLSAVVSEEGSDDVAFRIAANDAFEQGLRQAQPVLLEPIMKLNINTPEEYLGDFVGDLQQRRGTIIKTDHRGDRSDIEAQAPLKELFGYSSAMRSISQGRASCSLEPLNYAPAPAADMALYQF